MKDVISMLYKFE